MCFFLLSSNKKYCYRYCCIWLEWFSTTKYSEKESISDSLSLALGRTYLKWILQMMNLVYSSSVFSVFVLSSYSNNVYSCVIVLVTFDVSDRGVDASTWLYNPGGSQSVPSSKFTASIITESHCGSRSPSAMRDRWRTHRIRIIGLNKLMDGRTAAVCKSRGVRGTAWRAL